MRVAIVAAMASGLWMVVRAQHIAECALPTFPACTRNGALSASGRDHAASGQQCSAGCAELWLGAVDQCAGATLSPEAETMTTACTDTTNVVLATTPPAVIFDGAACNLGANQRYVLQQVTLNRKPQYSTSDGSWHLFWSGSYWNVGKNVCDMCGIIAIASPSQAPPLGSALWTERCADTGSVNRRIQLSPCKQEAGWCPNAMAVMIPHLEETCCQPADGRDCGREGTPHACEVDCAHHWQTYESSCPGDSDLHGNSFVNFLNTKCNGAAAGLLAIEETVVIQEGQTHFFTFNANSGTRYEALVRVGEGTGPGVCPRNAYDDLFGDGSCDMMIANGVSCAEDLCATCDMAPRYCDRSCEFQCDEDGISVTRVWILPPGAAETEGGVGQAVASETHSTSDKGIGFTATATGKFAVEIEATVGSGPVTVSINAVGTAVQRAMHLQVDGKPHPLSVSCLFATCDFEYDETKAIDGDGAGFDLLLPNAQAGLAYALVIELPEGQPAAQVRATVYQPGAADGAGGFESVVEDALGNWTRTPSDHQSLAEYEGCHNDDRSCINGLRASFGVYPGQSFERFARGTFVAPASGAILLRLVINCDVPFLADVQAKGCVINENYEFGCPDAGGYNATGYAYYNSMCTSDLRLTVTPGAYFEETGRRRVQTGGDHIHQTTETHAPTYGIAQRTDTIVIGRADVETQAAAIWRSTKPTDLASPSLDDMLVNGTEASGLLASMFTSTQQPSLVYPLVFEALGDQATPNGRRRRMQTGGDRLHIDIETRAPSALSADQAENGVISRLAGAEDVISGCCESCIAPR